MKVSKTKLSLRIIKNNLFSVLVVTLSIIACIPLILILIYLISKGASSINLEFIIHNPKPVGEPGGGVLNAIIGSGLLVLIASILSIPLGVSVGMYLSEFRKTKLAGFTRFAIDLLQGIPSIVIGIVAYLWLVKPFGKFTAVSGGVALAMLMVPVVAKSTEETLKMIPGSLKEASLALGVPYYKTVLKVILPTGLSGIITGILLGIARIAGETAPLLFTAFGSPFLTFNVLKPVNSLPLLIFNYASSPYPDWHRLAWGASFLLVLLVLILNLVAKWISKKRKIKF